MERYCSTCQNPQRAVAPMEEEEEEEIPIHIFMVKPVFYVLLSSVLCQIKARNILL
jgi:hypothetical protein